ncbi:MAG: HAD-IIIA family hydrolase [Gammaproteobacteria bacterium]|nr:HAD-IIIA family hydrolase [Gammaproteobacteria bacterium]
MQDILERASRIKLVIFDVDGVLTDGSLFLSDDGQEYKAFNSKDGFGMRLLQDAGIDIGIITGRESMLVKLRMKELGISYVLQGRREKGPALDEMMETTGLTLEQIAYVGDDVVDLPIMSRVGFSIAVQDARPIVKKHAHWITQSPGGRGAGRDVCELILEAHGKWDDIIKQYLA